MPKSRIRGPTKVADCPGIGGLANLWVRYLNGSRSRYAFFTDGLETQEN